mmetsp:Transcript_10318/g.29006  ORF Transcript_10318/g.29006 Transcript_10318/m.29006 type:complete len:1103 (+) Transcript_10318:44-3352(+)
MPSSHDGDEVQSVSFVPSTRPKDDAAALLRITSGRFIVTEKNERSVTLTLVNKSDGDEEAQRRDASTSIILLEVGGDPQHQQQQQHSPVPNATMILTESELSSLIKSANNNVDGYTASDAFTVKSSSANWTLVQLSGGGSILLASSAQDLCAYATDLLSDVDIDARSEQEKSEEQEKLLDAFEQDIEEPPYNFPSLGMSVLSNTDIVPGFTINHRGGGVPIESDLFVGKVLLMMRPPNSAEDDPYYHEQIFYKKKRRFEIQIQGRFKYVPEGTVWCGFEISEQMQLGLVSKGLCNLLLRLVSKAVPGDMHYSFGDKNNDELPHISFPAWTLFDKVVVSKEGETPPPLGPEVLPETNSVARKRSGQVGDWNTTDTYSFSYHSMYLDLPIWHVVNLPTSDIDLSQFWGESKLRIVVYENDSGNGKHLQRDNRYIAGIQAQYLGFKDDQSIADVIDENDARPMDQNKLSLISRSISYNKLEGNVEPEADASVDGDESRIMTVSASIMEGWDNSTVESDDETTFYDATGMLRSESELALEGGRVYVEDDSSVGFEIETSYVCDESSRNHLLYDMLCPAWIDVPSDQRGKYRRVFAFVIGDEASDVFFRSVAEFSELFSMAEANAFVDQTCSPRLSAFEKQRRIMGYTLAACRHIPSARSTQRCLALRNQKGCRFGGGKDFLNGTAPVDLKASRTHGEAILLGCYVARALSERHWVEEYAIITSECCSFLHQDSKRPSYRIHLRGILGVHNLDRSDCPYFPSFHFLAIETVSRVIYLMFRSNPAREEAMETILQARAALAPDDQDSNLSADTFDDQTLHYIHKSSVYFCKQRRLLNNRKFAFTSLGKIAFDDREGPDNIHPLTLVQSVLSKALRLPHGLKKSVLDDFLDSTAELKNANLAGLSEKERCAFYINLYHVMVIHGQLVFGPPTSTFGSNSFVNHFSMVAYEIGDDMCTLSELEHNIIRAPMNSPSQFASRFVLPKSVYKHALKKADCRINFALNCGSISNPEYVQVFTAENLDYELDIAMRDYLVTAKVSSNGKTITLPKICQWYSSDFGRKHTDVVRLCAPHLNDQDRMRLSPNLSGIHIRHLGFDFKCRPLRLRVEVS